MSTRATIHAAATLGRRAMLLAIAACALAALLHAHPHRPVAPRTLANAELHLTTPR